MTQRFVRGKWKLNWGNNNSNNKYWRFQFKISITIPYVCFKFVRQEAVGIYYIPWPAKKIAAQISYQGCMPKTAQICAACTAIWPKLPRNELQKNILYDYLNHWSPIYTSGSSFKSGVSNKRSTSCVSVSPCNQISEQ